MQLAQMAPFHKRRYSTAFYFMFITVDTLRYKKRKNGDRRTVVFTAALRIWNGYMLLINVSQCYVVELPTLAIGTLSISTRESILSATALSSPGRPCPAGLTSCHWLVIISCVCCNRYRSPWSQHSKTLRSSNVTLSKQYCCSLSRKWAAIMSRP